MLGPAILPLAPTVDRYQLGVAIDDSRFAFPAATTSSAPATP